MNFPLRVNISLRLNPELEDMVRSLNRQIVERGYDGISFVDGSPHIPHVTLLMGEVTDAVDFGQLVSLCNDFAHLQKPFRYRVSKPYLMRPSQHFIFVDTLPQETFRVLRRSLHETAGEELECEHHGGPDNPSHITIGYAKPIYPDLDHLCESFQRTTGVAEEIQICRAGNYGTCIEILHKINLG